jgi:hypothetical protein
MRVIVAGSRGIRSLEVVAAAIAASGFTVTEIVSGAQRTRDPVTGAIIGGADYWGEQWAAQQGVPVKLFPADWSLGRRAGPLRNESMAVYGQALVAVWDGQSRGTADMIRRARAHGLPVHVHRIAAPQETT